MYINKTSIIGVIFCVVLIVWVISASASKRSSPRSAEPAVQSQNSPASNVIEKTSLPTTPTEPNTTMQTVVGSSTDVTPPPLYITSIYPSSGSAGTVVTLTGSGIGELATITIDGLDEVRHTGADTFESKDYGSSTRLTITIPSDLPVGTYRIWIEDQREAVVGLKEGTIPVSNSVNFTVTSGRSASESSPH